MVCGSRRGLVIVRRRESVIAAAGLARAAATLAPAVTCWMNRDDAIAAWPAGQVGFPAFGLACLRLSSAR
jgi:hypothetical protein